MEIRPVAFIKTDFKDKFGIPRQSGRSKSLKGEIIFEEKYKNSEIIRGIENFSHLWLIFGFSDAKYDGKSMTVRPPRLGGNTRVGIFASRSPYRPNSLGLSVVKLESVDYENITLTVSGIDLLDNTPIYDIKPYLPYADSVEEAFGSYGDENSSYKLSVIFPPDELQKIDYEKRAALIECLSDDPRPSYHNDDRIYSVKFSRYDIHFKVFEKTLTVVSVDI